MILSILSLYLMSLKGQQEPVFDLTVKVQNIKDIRGTIKYALYDNDHSFLEEAVTFGGADVSDHMVEFKIGGLKEGVYALSIFHDENDNDELDSNFIGIPTEPYAFSNNAKGKFGPPTFNECRFELSNSRQIMIEL